MADTKQTKSVGEHWVASELARRGWAPAFTRDGLARTDILAVRATPERPMIEVQVKAAVGAEPKGSWLLGEKAQLPPASDREWFVLCLIDKDVTVTVRGFVVPRAHIAAAAWIQHMDWLTDESVPADKRNAPVDRARVYVPSFLAYEGRWDLLEESAYDAPVLLPPRFRELALEPRVGLPPKHPWLDRMPDW
ncbi:hypothetical protein [Pseudoclavibacter sp. VKM Ac-2867]|uniref:hypothetical protein n=1 Tax=Pseudoclavibacter sp. VKM Ac-2867 TaxID=2783829 RepID=UPI001889F61B|nr:hypothetical protein [Pseudoclavibacter sp. VKM Ac-2867]MBF4459476.1 hypothetical protein [Pseudoclavibacter sp. VKM Ac-2867]